MTTIGTIATAAQDHRMSFEPFPPIIDETQARTPPVFLYLERDHQGRGA